MIIEFRKYPARCGLVLRSPHNNWVHQVKRAQAPLPRALEFQDRYSQQSSGVRHLSHYRIVV